MRGGGREGEKGRREEERERGRERGEGGREEREGERDDALKKRSHSTATGSPPPPLSQSVRPSDNSELEKLNSSRGGPKEEEFAPGAHTGDAVRLPSTR